MYRKIMQYSDKQQQPILQRHSEYQAWRDEKIRNFEETNNTPSFKWEKTLYEKSIEWLEGRIGYVRWQMRSELSVDVKLDVAKEAKRERLGGLDSEIDLLKFEKQVAYLRFKYCNDGKYISDEDIIRELISRDKVRNINSTEDIIDRNKIRSASY